MKNATKAGNELIRKQLIDDFKKAIESGDIKKANLATEKFAEYEINRLEQLNQALLWAFDNIKPKMIEYLVTKGAEINSKNEGSMMTPIFAAADKNNLEWFKKILTKVDQEIKAKLLNSKDNNGETILFLLLRKEELNIKLIDFIKDNGAEVEGTENKYGQSLAALYTQKIVPLKQISSKNSTTLIDIKTSQEIILKSGNNEDLDELPISRNNMSGRSKNLDSSLRLSTEKSLAAESTQSEQDFIFFEVRNGDDNQSNEVDLAKQTQNNSLLGKNSDSEYSIFKLEF